MSNKVDVNGVVRFSKDFPHPSVGLDISAKPIQNKDFAYDVETRDLKVVESDIEDREAYIQSFANETGVYNVMKMFAKTGDASLLNRKQGFYADMSNIPVDELNPAAYQEAAAQSVANLSKTLGVDLSVDELSKMTDAQLMDLINNAVKARTAKADEVKEGE